jgi:hypothetical protein
MTAAVRVHQDMAGRAYLITSQSGCVLTCAMISNLFPRDSTGVSACQLLWTQTNRYLAVFTMLQTSSAFRLCIRHHQYMHMWQLAHINSTWWYSTKHLTLNKRKTKYQEGVNYIIRNFTFRILNTTTYSRVLREKLIVAHHVNKFTAFYSTQRLTVFTTARHWT